MDLNGPHPFSGHATDLAVLVEATDMVQRMDET